MNSNDQTCTCPDDGYTPHCPYAFFQGGQMLHEVRGDGRLKTRYEVIKAAPGSIKNSPHSSSSEEFGENNERHDSLCEMQSEEKVKPRLFQGHNGPSLSAQLYDDLESKFEHVPRRNDNK